MDQGELPRDLLTAFHRKLGATPRFVEQASAVLGKIDPDRLREQLENVDEPAAGTDPDELHQLQQAYFHDLFLPQLYEALAPEFRLALSRLALVEIPLPLDGVARVAGLGEDETSDAVSHWLRLSMVQRFGEEDEVPLFAVYPLQREFLTADERFGGRRGQCRPQRGGSILPGLLPEGPRARTPTAGRRGVAGQPPSRQRSRRPRTAALGDRHLVLADDPPVRLHPCAGVSRAPAGRGPTSGSAPGRRSRGFGYWRLENRAEAG